MHLAYAYTSDSQLMHGRELVQCKSPGGEPPENKVILIISQKYSKNTLRHIDNFLFH